MEQIEIRKARIDDVPAIYDLVKELALFEKAPDEVSSSFDDFIQNGFQENPIFASNLIFFEGKLAGFALWYFRFSTWKGKRLYLEDLYIKEEFRSLGLGKMLLDETVLEAKRTRCTGMMWQVLDWNEPAIQFYSKYGVKFDAGWLNVHLDL
ncbi:GNAT family N-acetyltransferase [Aquirufa nivalisilvae]|jgi:GNAT superfamily N-acetyltransferase|uniref:GNAT family N-acetyltransferase n=1 Tax=Aquirufa nivalisilvae TaxID=2516557 RepID=UPI0022A9C9B6|nr:GNAT family N-acetyltransferase [Aquirufa nivalisilvae]MCZ2480267.1 GNAT family N-acetyltransferase [Aquirufa nivalisilvae]MCZ2482338.1 GNAT family N-acetyltransferase [Aquirufa nivalisilvae]